MSVNFCFAVCRGLRLSYFVFIKSTSYGSLLWTYRMGITEYCEFAALFGFPEMRNIVNYFISAIRSCALRIIVTSTHSFGLHSLLIALKEFANLRYTGCEYANAIIKYFILIFLAMNIERIRQGFSNRNCFGRICWNFFGENKTVCHSD